MHNTYNLTTAKAKLSSIISEVEYSKKKVFITRKGKNVAAIIPFNEYQEHMNQETKNEGLILAKGALSDLEGFDEFIDSIYKSRKSVADRKVNI